VPAPPDRRHSTPLQLAHSPEPLGSARKVAELTGLGRHKQMLARLVQEELAHRVRRLYLLVRLCFQIYQAKCPRLEKHADLTRALLKLIDMSVGNAGKEMISFLSFQGTGYFF